MEGTGLAKAADEMSTTASHRSELPASAAAFQSDPDLTRSGVVAAWVPRRGAVVGARYRLLGEIGRGGMSYVWEADDLEAGERVVVKFLRADLDGDGRRRFEAEGVIVARLRSSSIAAVRDHGVDGDVPFIVMERLVGEDLAATLRREGRIPLRDCVAIVRDVARGLEAAHRAGVVHRDVKVQNVFLARGSDGSVTAKLLDFGVAKLRDVGPRTRTGLIVGSPLAMSPEQILGRRTLDGRSDLFSFGAMIYRCILGVPPFRGDLDALLEAIQGGRFAAPSTVDPTLPRALDAFFRRALAVEPSRRFATARELAEAFAVAAGVDEPAVDLHAAVTQVVPLPLAHTRTTRPPPPVVADEEVTRRLQAPSAALRPLGKRTARFAIPLAAPPPRRLVAPPPAPTARPSTSSLMAGAALGAAVVGAITAILS